MLTTKTLNTIKKNHRTQLAETVNNPTPAAHLTTALTLERIDLLETLLEISEAYDDNYRNQLITKNEEAQEHSDTEFSRGMQAGLYIALTLYDKEQN